MYIYLFYYLYKFNLPILTFFKKNIFDFYLRKGEFWLCCDFSECGENKTLISESWFFSVFCEKKVSRFIYVAPFKIEINK